MDMEKKTLNRKKIMLLVVIIFLKKGNSISQDY